MSDAADPRAAIDGATRLFVIIGDPVAQVKAPPIFNRLFAAAGRNAVMVPMEIPTAAFDRIFPPLLDVPNLDGIVVTIPHKSAVIPYLADVGETARVIGALNSIRRRAGGGWEGEMFDGKGFMHGLAGRGVDLRGKRALVVGCGGAGAAVTAEIVRAGIGRLVLHDVDVAKAEALAARLATMRTGAEIVVGSPDPRGMDLVVNTTPLGMAPDDPLPLDVTQLAPTTFVADVVMKIEKTRLLVEAERRGCPIQLGRATMDGQIANWKAYYGL
jgi:shikimate dehydrogenase